MEKLLTNILIKHYSNLIKDLKDTIEDTNNLDKPLLVKYDSNSLGQLLNKEIDDWSKNFLTQILEGEYDTVTQKQYDKLKEIAKKVNYTGPLAQ
jgi:hypothetical protein